MRIELSSDNTWCIRDMQHLERSFLEQVADAADPTGSKKALDRLFPPPLDRADMESEEEFLLDWHEYVAPELRDIFRSSLQTLTDDLKELRSKDEDGVMKYSVTVPVSHAEDWYRSLNQARLVLSQKFDLPESDLDFDAHHTDIDARWLAWVQSGVYAFIQSFLVEAIMSRDL